MKKGIRFVCVALVLAAIMAAGSTSFAAKATKTKDPTVYYVMETSEKYHKNTKCRSLKKTPKENIVSVKLSECPSELERCKICKPQKR